MSFLPTSAESCLHRLFEAQAARTPHAPAVVFEGRTLFYDALNRRANRLANRLRALGVGPESLVGLCLERSPEMVVGLLGILKAGGAYLPLDPEYPADRLAFMLEDAQARILLTTTALQPQLPGQAEVVLCLDEDVPGGEAEEENLAGGAGPDNLAYVIYTSGSTGRPKGVLLAHRGACNNLAWRQDCFPLAGGDRLLQTYSFSFDPSVWAFFWPLVSGAAVVLPPPGDHGDPARLAQTIQTERITVAGFSPSLLSALLLEPELQECGHLRHVFCGGETLSPELRDRFFRMFPQTQLHNVYGPTEATIDSTWWTCRREDDGPRIPIGRPLPGTEAWVLGEDGQPVRDGDAGELHVAGVGLARGYLRRPELSAEKFIPNPFDPGGFPTLYRTGDLVRRGPDGALDYLGRLDDQVKLRGFRIELGEIESALVRQPRVREAVATVREDRDGDKRLVAYLVAEPGATPSRAALKSALASALPSHMVPGAFVFVPTLPLSPNGKRDRRVLPPPTAADWERDGESIAPQTPLQKQFAAVFADLLDIESPGIRDDFFEWGGHSLLAARLVDRLGQICGRKVPLTILKDGATVERLAALLEDAATDDVPQSPLLQRWSDGPGQPFFFLHGDFTGGYYCSPLSRLLGTERPFYALLPHGADGGPIPPTVEAMAADYLAMIRAVQPTGPYLLGGFCNGGLTAYEIARQLEAQGEEVALLALVEIVVPATLVKLGLHDAAFRVGRRLNLSAPKTHALSDSVQRVVTPLLLGLKSVREQWQRGLRTLTRDGGPDWAAIIPKAYRDSAAHYHLRPYGGQVVIITAEDSPEKEAACAGWGDLAAHVVCDTMPGNHFTSLKQQLPGLAACLRRHIDAATAGKSAVARAASLHFSSAPGDAHLAGVRETAA